MPEAVPYRSSVGLSRAPDTLSASAWQALLESVDYCPMGITIH
jgi:hypothetical protein